MCAHVDDFLVSGNEQDHEWVTKLRQFWSRLSQWERSNSHCGLQIVEQQDYSFVLDHSKFIASVEKIVFQNRADHEPVTSEDVTQLHGVLRAFWAATERDQPFDQNDLW